MVTGLLQQVREVREPVRYVAHRATQLLKCLGFLRLFPYTEKPHELLASNLDH
jgi:hypothetical protein